MSTLPLLLATYRIAIRVMEGIPQTGKLAASLAGRRRAEAHWDNYRRTHQRRNHVIWFHAASVGEALVLEPVIQRLRVTVADLETILTFSSPSVADWPNPLGVDEAGFAPPENPRGVARVFDAIRPDLMVFSRSDLWPEMLLAAAERNVPIAVVGAVVRPGSARTGWPARPFLRRLYRHINFVGAVADRDAERWISLGAPLVTVTGDPRHDQVLERTTDLPALRPLLPWAEEGPALVAGSVEADDEMPLLEAYRDVVKGCREARILMVPHDPTAAAVRRIAERAERAGISAQVLAEGQKPVQPCLILTRRGVLASLYALAKISYVGGGFRPGRLHAVIEPAAFGVPLVIGPEFGWSTEARRLVSKGGAASLPRTGASQALASIWTLWLGNERERDRAGNAARTSLSGGAAGSTARHLSSLLRG